MNLSWKDARRLIPNLDDLLRRQGHGENKPPGPAVGVPVCTRLEVSPARWSVTVQGWCPASDNVRAKGVKRWIAAKKADRAILKDWLCDYARIPRAAGKRRVSVWVAKKGPLVDGQNLWKSLADGLVNVGLLVDDGPDWFEAGPITVAKGVATETTLLIEDIGC